VGLGIASVLIGLVIGVVLDLGKKMRGHFIANRRWKRMVFEMFKDKEGKYRFRLKGANGEIVAASESYKTE
jgi:membrane-associated PAP2 superfamily phosphatase